MTNAYSVILDNQIDIFSESQTSATKKESITICILNEKGKDAAFFNTTCDKFSTLLKFSGEISDRTGRVIKKVKKSDLQMTAYSQNLADGSYTYYYDAGGPSYPFTVKFEWEIKYKDGILSYPPFMPQNKYNQSVVKACYRFHPAPNVSFHSKSMNTTVRPEERTNGKETWKEVQLSGLKALVQEAYAPNSNSLVPYIFFDPIDFYYDGEAGSMASWRIYGAWQKSLLEGRDILPEFFQTKLKELTAQCTTDREKVKTLYDYLAETTRYVSIQLGIGGFQPMQASEVNKIGFGDCKALSNYMMAMLKAVGIPSVYTEISTVRKDFMPDYMNQWQTNHVILQVPLPNDTLWLECTNAKLPFGYVHSDIAGHNALLIEENGGRVCRLPTYPDSLNTQNTQIIVELNAEGSASIQVKQRSSLFQYEEVAAFAQSTPEKQKAYLLSDMKLNNARIADIRCTEYKESHPYGDITYTIACDRYGSKTGNRLFIQANPFRSRRHLSTQKRINDIYIGYGYADTDVISIHIPEGFTVESLPSPAILTNQFGSFLSFCKAEGNTVKITQRLFMKSGTYSKDLYEEFTNFNRTISSRYGDKIVLKRL
jgi:transglutaminase-like putative cysteine protease